MSNIITAIIGAALGGGVMLWTLLFLHKRAQLLNPPSASQRESARWCDCGADCC